MAAGTTIERRAVTAADEHALRRRETHNQFEPEGTMTISTSIQHSNTGGSNDKPDPNGNPK